MLPIVPALIAPFVVQEATTEPVALSYLTPAAVAFRLDAASRGAFPVTFGKVTLAGPTPDGKGLLVRGTPGARSSFQLNLATIDRKERTARIAFQVVQAEFAADGTVRETPLLGDFHPLLSDRDPFAVGVGTRVAGGFGLRALCKIEGDRVEALVRLDRGRKPPLRERGEAFTELEIGKTIRVCGVVDRATEAVQKAVMAGGKPPTGKPIKVFYVDARLMSVSPLPTRDERQDIVALQHVTPAEVESLTGPLAGVTRTVADSKGGALLIEGPESALQAARTRIAAVDRAPSPVQMLIRLVRIDFPVGKMPTETVVKETTVTTNAGAVSVDAAPIPLSFSARALPTGERSAWIFPQLKFRVVPTNGGQRERTMVAGASALMSVGQARRLGGVPRTLDPSVYATNPKKRAAWELMSRGAEPQSGFPMTAYFVDVVVLKVGA